MIREESNENTHYQSKKLSDEEIKSQFKKKGVLQNCILVQPLKSTNFKKIYSFILTVMYFEEVNQIIKQKYQGFYQEQAKKFGISQKKTSENNINSYAKLTKSFASQSQSISDNFKEIFEKVSKYNKMENYALNVFQKFNDQEMKDLLTIILKIKKHKIRIIIKKNQSKQPTQLVKNQEQITHQIIIQEYERQRYVLLLSQIPKSLTRSQIKNNLKSGSKEPKNGISFEVKAYSIFILILVLAFFIYLISIQLVGIGKIQEIKEVNNLLEFKKQLGLMIQ